MMNHTEAQVAQTSQTPSAPPSAAPSLSPAINDPRRKRPLLAAFLSLIPGLGQIYVGYYKRGFTNAIIFALLVAFMSAEVEPLMPMVGIFIGFFFLYNIVDAWRRASLYNQALAGGSELELPDEFELPSLGGSLAGGTVLIFVGLLLLAHTLFGMTLEWIEDWWPLALVGLGAYLVVKAIRERSEAGEPLDD